VAERSTIH